MNSSCTSYSQIYTFVEELDSVINHIIRQLTDERKEERDEVRTMIRASQIICLPTVISYMSHRTRAVTQFKKIKSEIEMFTECNYGLWFDHNQMILPMRAREGQIEYFGKRGMSLLGSMFVRREKRIRNDIKVEGLLDYLYDAAVHNYSSPDNVQVLSVLTVIIKQIEKDSPNMDKVMM